jgi:hypothetical protein
MSSSSSFRIDKEGRWYYEGEEITHRRTYLLYARNLTRDESGRILLQVDQERCPVEVEDAPYIVKTLNFLPAPGGGIKGIELILNDETREELKPETLRIGDDHVPYCQVREGMFEARFSRNAYQLLLPHIQQAGSEGPFYILLDGKRYDL